MNKYFKKIEGKKCYLSPMNLEDAQVFTQWFNDAQVVDFLTGAHWVLNVEKEKEVLASLSREQNFSIITQEDDKLIGNCGLMSLDQLNGTAELGIMIGEKEYWSRGFGLEAVKLLCSYGFNILNLENILLRVFDYNERAKKCYLKAGFKVIGIRRNALKRNLKQFHVVYMDITKEDFSSWN